MNDPAARLPLSIRLGWAAGSMVPTMLMFVVNTFFLRFMTDYVGIGAALAGILLASTKFFDAAINPLMGTITDNTRSRFGRRRPYILAGALLGASSLLVIFAPPASLSHDMLVAMALAGLLLFSIGYTVFAVPHLSMPAEMTNSPQERAVLASFRVYALAGSQLLASSLSPLLVKAYGGDRAAFGAMAATFGVIIAAIGVYCFFATRSAAATTMSTEQRSQFWSSLPSILRNRPYMALIMTKMTLLAGSTAHTASAAYYVRYIMLRGEGTLAMFLLAHSLGMVVSQYFWLRLIARFGKVPCYVAAALTYTGVSIVWMLLDPALPWQIFVAFSFVNGCGAGGILLVPEALLPDMISQDYAISGMRREGTLASLYTFSEKAAHALGITITGALLAWYGYAAPAAGHILSESGKWAVTVTFGLAPAILVGGSSFWLLSIRRRIATAQPA